MLVREDVDAVLATLFDIRLLLTEIRHILIARAREENEAAPAAKLLLARMAYRGAKIVEEREAAEARAERRRRVRRLVSFGLLHSD